MYDLTSNRLSRVVRSVADFPRIVYILSYDRDVLANALEQSLGVQNGERYLQKVVQLSLPMPAFEPFDLRLQLKDELLSLHTEFEISSLDSETKSDFDSAIDSAGSFISTPREVTLITNAVRFAWLASHHDTYYADVCRVQIYKVVRRDLYNWLEDYLGIWSVITTGVALANKVEKARIGEALISVLPDDDTSPNSIYALTGIVLGLSESDKAEERVFGSFYPRDVDALTERKRLGSPVHFRAYFAFAIPRTVLSDADWKTLLEAAESDHADLEVVLSRHAKTLRPVGGSWLTYVLDRLNEREIERMNSAQLANLFLALANVMDTILDFTRPWIPFAVSDDDRAARVARTAMRQLKKVDQSKLKTTFSEALEDGHALSWLVSIFVRDELYARGEIGEGRNASNEPIFSDESLNFARATLIARIERIIPRSTVLELPRTSRFLRGWQNLSNEERVREWVSEVISDDYAFIRLLKKLRGQIFSDRSYYVLKAENVSNLLDWDNALKRLEELEEKVDDEQLSHDIVELRTAVALGKSH